MSDYVDGMHSSSARNARAAQFSANATGWASSAKRGLQTAHIEVKKKLQKCRHASQRDIGWAVTPETKKREYAVTQLYPRLLYTFSDGVVFVMRNLRAFESTVLEILLELGSSSTNKSLNQPALHQAKLPRHHAKRYHEDLQQDGPNDILSHHVGLRQAEFHG
ncbi:hypothetical protein F4823DRAFT_558847 [Ustulina deusta]|nr:hypothetical protein F4823DRAFT_558847 [Ustulina deusta]